MGRVGSGRSGRSGEWVPTPHSPGGETAVVSFSQKFTGQNLQLLHPALGIRVQSKTMLI